MTTHTPGPWSYSKSDFGDGRYSIYANGPLATTASEADYGDSALPNARLIAEAPNLLSEIEELVACLKAVRNTQVKDYGAADWTTVSKPIQEAEYIIAKVKGC